MLATILSILGAAGTIAGGIIAYKNSANRQRRAAEKDVEAHQKEIEEKTDMIKDAVYSHDDDKLNQIVSSLMRPALAIALVVVGIGCSSQKTVYIPTDRRIESCTNSIGIACKAVPDAVMVEMLEKLQELQDLKTQQKVDKRLEK